MIKYCTINMLRLIGIIVIGCLALTIGQSAQAKKIYPAVYGRIYLSSGDSIVAGDTLHVIMPKKHKKLEIIDNAYTTNNSIQSRIDPETIDSVVIWSSTAPERTHTFRYIRKLGWCFEAEQNPYISVYCYAKKGYYCAGNGGIWMRGKSEMFIIKDGKIYKFGKPNKKVNQKMRSRLELLLADDPALTEYIKTAKGRCDKVLRSLKLYNPKN